MSVRDIANLWKAQTIWAAGAPAYLLACNGPIDNSSEPEQAFAAESPYYQRRLIAPIYATDTIELRAEASISDSFTAVGGTLIYDRVVIVFNGSPNAPAIFTDSDIDIATNVITIASHGLSNGDPVLVNTSAGSTMPGGLTAGVIKYVEAVNADTLKLYDEYNESTLTNPVNFTSPGSGTLRLHYCQGTIWHVVEMPSPETLGPGASIPVNLDLYSQKGAPTVIGV